MPLTFQPSPGQIIMCNYAGFVPPEMVKVRPVLVLSPRRRTAQLATLVPLSSTAPIHMEPWHILVPPGIYPPARGPMWAKADVLATVALSRLDRVKWRAPGQQPSYHVFLADPALLAAVQAGVKAALGLA